MKGIGKKTNKMGSHLLHFSFILLSVPLVFGTVDLPGNVVMKLYLLGINFLIDLLQALMF